MASRLIQNKIVMARFMRAIHDLAASIGNKDVDGPDKPGHDVVGWFYSTKKREPRVNAIRHSNNGLAVQ